MSTARSSAVPRRVSAQHAPFDVSDHQKFADPYKADAVALLDAAVAAVSA
jgi:hypothetical protein